MITAVITQGENTLVMDFPRGIMDMMVKLLSIGIKTSPEQITLFDDNEHDIKVQIVSDSDIGKHLCRLFSENNTLSDVNTVAWLVKNADKSFLSDLENDIVYDQYGNVAELIEDIKERTLSAGPVEKTFYFPLTGYLSESDDDFCTVDDSFLSGYEYAIRDLIKEYTEQREIGNIATGYKGNEGVKSKLVSADWSVEDIHNVTYGKTTVRLKAELTESETDALKEWIRMHNCDGVYECLEQHPIDSEDGKLSISLWRGNNNYFIYDRAELDEHIQAQREMKMGGM